MAAASGDTLPFRFGRVKKTQGKIDQKTACTIDSSGERVIGIETKKLTIRTATTVKIFFIV